MTLQLSKRQKKEALLFPILDILLNGFNFMMVLYLSNKLGDNSYGIFTALIAMASILFIIGISVQTYTAKSIDASGTLPSEMNRVMVKTVLCFNVVFLIFGFWMKEYMRTNLISMLLLMLMINIHTLLCMERGKIQGRKQFRQLNINFYIEVVSRVALTVVLMQWSLSYELALFALTLGMALSYFHGVMVDHNYRHTPHDDEAVRTVVDGEQNSELSGNLIYVLLGNGCIFFMSAIDILIVNNRMSSYSGVYGLSSKFTDLMIAVSISVGAVIVPLATGYLHDSKAFRAFVYKWAGIIALMMLSIYIGYIVILPFVTSLLFAEYSTELGWVIRVQSIGTVFFGITQFLLLMQIVRDYKKHITFMLTSCAAYLIVLNLINGDIMLVLITDITIQTLLCMTMLLTFRKRSDSMKTRLLFLSWRDILHKKAGGAEVFTHEMLKRLDSERYDIVHISPASVNKNGDKNQHNQVLDGIQYLRHGNMVTVIFYAMFYYLMHRNAIDYVIDQCNTHRFFTPFWVKSSKRVFFIHQMTKEIWTMNLPSLIGYIGAKLEGFMTSIYKKSSLVLTVSNSTKNDLMYYGIPEKSIVVLPEGINFVPWDAKAFVKKEEGLFTYVGRFSSYKGIDVAVEAFCRLYLKYPMTRLQIIGKKNQDYIDNVLDRIRKRYDVPATVINYLGFVSEEEKLKQMSRSQTLLFPSMREGWGLTVTEGAAVGTPSIVFKSPGLVDAVDNGRAGYMTEENNVFEVQKLMESVMTDKKRYETMKEAAYNFSKQFNWDNTSDSFARIF